MAVETVHVGIERDGLPIVIMQVVANDHHGIEREVTDEVIADEIARSAIEKVTGWSRIDPASIPADRSNRANWTIAGGKIKG